MLTRLLIFTLVAASAIGIANATEPATPQAKLIHTLKSASGGEMFSALCTGCHGVDGKGFGPVVAMRNVPPVDLTVLSRKNKGVFPKAHVAHVLEYGADVPSHTSVEMPVWGPILGKINQNDPRDRELRINSLSGYLETIQVK